MTSRQRQVLIGLGAVGAVLVVVLVVGWVIGWQDETAPPTTLGAGTSTSPPFSTTSSSSTTTDPSSTTTSSTTSTSTTTPTSSSTTTTTLPPVACPGPGAGALPAGAEVFREVRGDFDGDGAGDRFVAYDIPDEWPEGRIELSYGYATEPINVYHWVDFQTVNLGGGADLLVVIQWGGYNEAAFHVVRGCSLDLVMRDDGELAVFRLQTDPTELNGVTCRADGMIEETRATSTDGTLWNASFRAWRWDPARSEFASTPGAGVLVLHWPEDADTIERYGSLDC